MGEYDRDAVVMSAWQRETTFSDKTTLESLGNLANVFHGKGEYERALLLHAECLATSKRVLGGIRPLVAFVPLSEFRLGEEPLMTAFCMVRLKGSPADVVDAMED
jgi:hypothetical protein